MSLCVTHRQCFLPSELQRRLADNPMVWMLQVNGLMVDIRRAPIELQQLAFEKGLIPFIPALQPEKT